MTLISKNTIIGSALAILGFGQSALACDFVQNSVDVERLSVTVDADLSDWENVDFQKIEETCASCDELNSKDMRAEFAVTVDQNNLYLVAVVIDDEVDINGSTKIFDLDGIEVMIDGFNNCSEKFYDDDMMLFVTADGRFQFKSPTRSTDRIEVATSIIEDGYMIELSIPWQIIGSYPDEASSMGFSISVNDRDGENREGQFFWHYSTKHWENTGDWASLHFLDNK